MSTVRQSRSESYSARLLALLLYWLLKVKPTLLPMGAGTDKAAGLEETCCWKVPREVIFGYLLINLT